MVRLFRSTRLLVNYVLLPLLCSLIVLVLHVPLFALTRPFLMAFRRVVDPDFMLITILAFLGAVLGTLVQRIVVLGYKAGRGPDYRDGEADKELF